jgi:hypothetical protein
MAQLASRLEVTYRNDHLKNGNDNHHHLKTRQDILTILRRYTDNIRPDDMGVKNIIARIEILDVSSYEERRLKRLVVEEIL